MITWRMISIEMMPKGSAKDVCVTEGIFRMRLVSIRRKMDSDARRLWRNRTLLAIDMYLFSSLVTVKTKMRSGIINWQNEQENSISGNAFRPSDVLTSRSDNSLSLRCCHLKNGQKQSTFPIHVVLVFNLSPIHTRATQRHIDHRLHHHHPRHSPILPPIPLSPLLPLFCLRSPFFSFPFIFLFFWGALFLLSYCFAALL